MSGCILVVVVLVRPELQLSGFVTVLASQDKDTYDSYS
jgi:hypothetical protein